ncbi:MAG: hypothetical protein ABI645_16960 [Pseudomonadota bacterium]
MPTPSRPLPVTLRIPHAHEFRIGDRRHERHAEMQRWVGGVFDPKGFDLNRINRDWKGSRRKAG